MKLEIDHRFDRSIDSRRSFSQLEELYFRQSEEMGFARRAHAGSIGRCRFS